ncbi:hypothetical protein [Ornithinimicrobium kibberense]|uniref:hypothetical protein n=1 Tax=Ornithinimicrobium kibberense TaxID=282060 RepID=UPI0036120994
MSSPVRPTPPMRHSTATSSSACCSGVHAGPVASRRSSPTARHPATESPSPTSCRTMRSPTPTPAKIWRSRRSGKRSCTTRRCSRPVHVSSVSRRTKVGMQCPSGSPAPSRPVRGRPASGSSAGLAPTLPRRTGHGGRVCS